MLADLETLYQALRPDLRSNESHYKQ
jgi:hypothetical protein